MKALTRMLTFSFVALAVIAIAGCGVSQEDYDKTASELGKTKADLAQAKTKIAELEKSLAEREKSLSEAQAQQKVLSEALAQAKSQPKQPSPAEKPAAAAVSASAQQAAPPAVKGLKDLVGKWTGWATSRSGSAFPMEVQINPDGSYIAMMGATSGRGAIKVDGSKIMAEGHLSGPAGADAGAGKSQLTVGTKGGKQVISGAGRNDAGPFDYELTKQ
jgi:hypothetical protein